MQTRTEWYEKALVRAKFRVKLKSLADEARTIRVEERRMRSKALVYQESPCRAASPLRDHRRGVVRTEVRVTLLARAFYLGIPYRKLEVVGSQPIPYERVKIVYKALTGKSVTQPELHRWASV